ncbi:hypothetical protein LTR85_009047 [Meristemomyces frigidus]|nr:hypothetical protein LTR85_009047 [Meristemomyces frigidus]
MDNHIDYYYNITALKDDYTTCLPIGCPGVDWMLRYIRNQVKDAVQAFAKLESPVFTPRRLEELLRACIRPDREVKVETQVNGMKWHDVLFERKYAKDMIQHWDLERDARPAFQHDLTVQGDGKCWSAVWYGGYQTRSVISFDRMFIE